MTQLVFEINGSDALTLPYDEQRPERSLLDIARGLAVEKEAALSDVSLRFVDDGQRATAR